MLVRWQFDKMLVSLPHCLVLGDSLLWLSWVQCGHEDRAVEPGWRGQEELHYSTDPFAESLDVNIAAFFTK